MEDFFSLVSPIRGFKVAASPHSFASSDSFQAQLSISSDTRNKIKVIDASLPALHERETNQNVTNGGALSNVTQHLAEKQPKG